MKNILITFLIVSTVLSLNSQVINSQGDWDALGDPVLASVTVNVDVTNNVNKTLTAGITFAGGTFTNNAANLTVSGGTTQISPTGNMANNGGFTVAAGSATILGPLANGIGATFTVVGGVGASVQNAVINDGTMSYNGGLGIDLGGSIANNGTLNFGAGFNVVNGFIQNRPTGTMNACCSMRHEVDGTIANSGTINLTGGINGPGTTTNYNQINTTGLSLVDNTTLINFGTIPDAAGIFIDATSTFINAGTYTAQGGGDCAGTIQNTGTMTYLGALIGNGSAFNCGTLTDRNGLTPPEIGIAGPTPVGTVCDDGDPTTTNEIILDAACSCAPGSSVPTLGEWGVIILSIIMMILGVAFLRQRQTQPVIVKS